MTLFLGDDNIHYIYLGVAHYRQHLHCTVQSNNTMFAATDLTVVIVKLTIFFKPEPPLVTVPK
jgi:hypothetical protein